MKFILTNVPTPGDVHPRKWKAYPEGRPTCHEFSVTQQGVVRALCHTLVAEATGPLAPDDDPEALFRKLFGEPELEFI